MTDILIRDVPENVIADIDLKAASAGLSRAGYLRRVLLREQADSSNEVTVESLARIAEMCSDLGRPEVMAGAWT
ncbi:MAG: antitoxin [Acidimicrobiia bacterium]|nr:antitoxin [Acidimicrobiia bacterium]MCY4457652.1 antitoxin [Acidimicrobiaceae bacterium]